jgi:hypothetical protein
MLSRRFYSGKQDKPPIKVEIQKYMFRAGQWVRLSKLVKEIALLALKS